MPIRPDQMSRYPGGSIKSPEWQAIRERIRARANDKCEGCGVPNGAVGTRLGGGIGFGYCHGATPGSTIMGLKVIKIVCTVAHVDGKLVDHSDDNLKFWCQQCHNRHDAKDRAAGVSQRRKATRATGDLLGDAS